MSKHLSIEDAPMNNFNRLLTVRSSGGSFVDGYVLSIIGVTLPAITTALNLSTFWVGMIAVSALLGIFAGGFIGGTLTDKLGRRLVYFIGPTLFITCSLAQFWVDSGSLLFFLRFLIGVGIGIEYPVATAFLVEFLPKRQRGPILAGLTICWFAGAAVAYLAGEAILVFGGSEAWRWGLLSTTLIAVMLLLVRLGTPESPRWLISKGRAEEASVIIKQVFGATWGLKNLPEQKSEVKMSFISLMRSGYGKRMFFFSMFYACSVIPVFAVYTFAPKVLEALNLSGGWASYGSIAITMLFVIGCIIATALVNSMGRRSLLIQSMLWSGVALLLLGYFSESSPMLILLLFGAYALLVGGAQVLQLVYPNEIFPTEIRASAVGVGVSFSRVGAMIGTYLVPISIQSIGIGHTMYAAAAVTAVGLITSWWLAPETSGVDLAEASALTEAEHGRSNFTRAAFEND